MNVAYKTPTEIVKLEWDFGPALPQGEALTVESAVTVANAAGESVPTMVHATDIPTDTELTAVIEGGVDGSDYIVTFIAVTTNDLRYEEKLKLKVRA